MKQTVLGIFSLSLFVLSVPATAFAVNYNPSINVKATPATMATTEAKPTETVNSFELFWPLAAGKTRADSLYFLKTWKENVRGFFIFGAVEKAEYQTFRATKRMLEVESLVNDSKLDLATTTAASANNYLNKSEIAFSASDSIQDELKMTVKNRLDNLIKLVDTLSERTKDSKDLHEQIMLTHTLIEKNLSVLTPKS